VLLPHAERAEIAPEKRRDYLLSTEHPDGRFKARFFAARGFSAERWQEPESALRLHHLTRDADPAAVGVHGQTYTIHGILNARAVGRRWL
jgi:hypothetical protein